MWFRQDLRIADNPALTAAVNNGSALAIYIWHEPQVKYLKMGAASKLWLHHSLEDLNNSLDNKLNIYQGKPQDIISKLIIDKKLAAVYWNRCYEPWRVKEDSELKIFLKNNFHILEVKSFNGSLLWEPFTVLKSDKTPYKVYTPFYNNGCLNALTPDIPLGLSDLKKNKLKNILIKDKNNPTSLDDLRLLKSESAVWGPKLISNWDVGEKAANKQLENFLKNNLPDYKTNRNFPGLNGVSRLSPYLHFGEISPQQVYHAVVKRSDRTGEGAQTYLKEIAWREFSYYLLYHFPDLANKNFRTKFDKFPWKQNKKFLKAWQTGQTGYPIIDAGMRELWQTGYIHNRVRMVVGSFLVKNLLLHWHHGRDWFWDCLVDADLANNSASWQWVAGSGADAAPYFRIFNPVTQGEKFDPEGIYTRKYVPELAKLNSKFLFRPWEAPEDELKSAGIILGKTYPKPIIDLKLSRELALEAYNAIIKL
ncbi:MAG: deoxyribodipyrimidine photo-lyase [Gammaproteobacteria bacterium]|nr:deoxyribodipyrimidine photo-lyase [Gammaproteobacteria bacterium]